MMFFSLLLDLYLVLAFDLGIGFPILTLTIFETSHE